MGLFAPDAQVEVIGTDAVLPGQGEWCISRQAARELIAWDWNYWGDLVIDVPGASINVHGETAWTAAKGTVTQKLSPEEVHQNFLEQAGRILEKETPAQTRIIDLIRGAANALWDAQLGETYIWPLRLTAVAILHENSWRFAQMHFSFPTLLSPDLRLT